MAVKRKPKNEFGQELGAFLLRTGITAKQVAKDAGVKYSTLIECTTGRCAGHELIPIVRKYIENHDNQSPPL